MKTTGLSDKPTPNRNDSNRSASNSNDNSKLAFRKNDDNNEVNRFGISRNSIKYAKKSGKLFKSRKSKSEKTSKSQNLAKLVKKLSKSENSTNFNTTEDGPKFLTFVTKITFNCLWLAFTEALILKHFDPKYHIYIETNVLSYAIDRVLSQLISRTNSNGVITKTNLG